ncbi:hypothetical protein F4821DRAFT_149267 [Hypoxylon rubiginosum]|uniref:Uncharacterized protein n=1 Tax=Hypoxylon rubiginosum TaxID=110542 RepID=A0ACC0CZP4_9PEZI|nr:hypothetical protein F4821DRAFT_149267 [Hypoxylon rubiginosum]
MVLTRSSKAAAEAQERFERKMIAEARRKDAYPHPQRSSLRRAIQISLRDVPTTAPSQPGPAQHPTANANTNGVPTLRSNWYHIRAIVAEARTIDGRLEYLVDWEGRDPRSGMPWPETWVSARDVTKTAIRAWEKRQKNTL